MPDDPRPADRQIAPYRPPGTGQSLERLRFDETPERLPPHNEEAEEAILGSVLLQADLVAQLSGIVEPRDFYRERNGIIFAAMLSIDERGMPVDYLTLIDELDRTQKLDQAGGPTYLAGLLGVVPSPIHAEHYAKIVAEAAFMRRLISAAGKIATIGWGNQHDAETALEKAETLLSEVPSRNTTGAGATPISDVIRVRWEELSARAEGQPPEMRVPAGELRDLNLAMAGGFRRSNLVLLAGRPGQGKTACALTIAMEAALLYQAAVLFYSLEMSSGELADRLIAMHSGVDLLRVQRATSFTPMEQRRIGFAIEKLSEIPLWIDDTSTISVSRIRSQTKRFCQKVPLDLVVVDHVSIVDPGDRYRGNRVQEMSEVSRQLKMLAKDENVPVLALSQLNRDVEKRASKVPVLSDLRESGTLEQDSDVVLMLYRDDAYNRDSERAGTADVYITKNRNGPTGQVSLLWNARATRFTNLEVAYEEGRRP